MVEDTVAMLRAEGLECDIVGGAGTGTYYFEGDRRASTTGDSSCRVVHDYM